MIRHPYAVRVISEILGMTHNVSRVVLVIPLANAPA